MAYHGFSDSNANCVVCTAAAAAAPVCMAFVHVASHVIAERFLPESAWVDGVEWPRKTKNGRRRTVEAIGLEWRRWEEDPDGWTCVRELVSQSCVDLHAVAACLPSEFRLFDVAITCNG